MRKLLWCLLFAPLLAHAVGPEQADDPWLLLEKAAEAAHKLTYKGVFVYQMGPNVNSFLITHVNYGTGELARLTVLDGAPREVLRQGNDAVIYQPSDKAPIAKRRVQSSFPAILPTVTDVLKYNYQSRQAGLERVGGRDGVVVQLDPRDKLRYGYRFWLDRQTSLLLKSMMLNDRGEVVQQIAFNQLWLLGGTEAGQPDAHTDADRSTAIPSVVEEKPRSYSAEGDGWVITQLPAGFYKVDQMRRNVAGKTVATSHLVLSDGLASVSLFIEPIEKNAAPKQGRCVQGATNVFANVVDDHQVVVVGEVPEATVRQIAGAVSFRK